MRTGLRQVCYGSQAVKLEMSTYGPVVIRQQTFAAGNRRRQGMQPPQ